MDISNSLNQKVLEYLLTSYPDSPLALLPQESKRDPYMHLGSHPDIVERIWKGIGAELDSDCRLIVCGTPALVQPQTSTILAFALGTQYCLHLPPDLGKTALAAGAKTTTKWSNGRVLDVAGKFGEGWIFGSWKKDEIDWCRQAYRFFGPSGE